MRSSSGTCEEGQGNGFLKVTAWPVVPTCSPTKASEAGLCHTHSAGEESEAQSSEGTFPGSRRSSGDVRT